MRLLGHQLLPNGFISSNTAKRPLDNMVGSRVGSRGYLPSVNELQRWRVRGLTTLRGPGY